MTVNGVVATGAVMYWCKRIIDAILPLLRVKKQLLVRVKRLELLKPLLGMLAILVGIITMIPELLFFRPISNLPKISFYPKAKTIISELEKEFNAVTSGIADISKNSNDNNFKELLNLIKRVYGFKGLYDEIKFEIHAYKPEIDAITHHLISTENRYYLMLLNKGVISHVEIIDGRLLELKMELDFMIRKRFAIAFVIISFGILVLELIK